MPPKTPAFRYIFKERGKEYERKKSYRSGAPERPGAGTSGKVSIENTLGKGDLSASRYSRPGIATKPSENCQEIIDRLREIGNRLNVLPLQVAKLSTEEKEALGKATREIWRLYDLVRDAFLPPYRYHMRTVIRMGGKEE